MREIYQNPLCRRYASRDMQFIFSDDKKFRTWRKLWVALAESEQELGLDITDAQIQELRAKADNINYEVAEQREKEVRHDTMAHIFAYGEQCPLAKPVLHLGATSSYVKDNTDIIVMREALILIKKYLINAMGATCDFAEKHKGLACLAYTHFQAAQPTTVGKRATLWLHDLYMDLRHINFALGELKLLGCRGTTGTSASFLELFDGNHEKIKELERKIAVKMGFEPGQIFAVSGQTYSRKLDYFVLSALSGIAQSAYKFSNDIRLLSHLKEIDEPFEDKQVGSSAMAYKQNPVRSERIAALSRYIIADALNPAMTASAQWLERTLDDSANIRISIPEAFLAVDGVLALYINIISGMRVYPKMTAKNLREELPFMATENILMYCVKKGAGRSGGGDRQVLHEAIRVHSVAAARKIKEGGENDLLERILRDKTFGLSEGELDSLLAPDKFTGRAKEQTEEFVCEIRQVLRENEEFAGIDVDVRV